MVANRSGLFKSLKMDFNAYELATLAELPSTHTKFSSLFLLGLTTLKEEIKEEEVRKLVIEKKKKLSRKLAYLYSPTVTNLKNLHKDNNLNSSVTETILNPENSINSDLPIPESTDPTPAQDAAKSAQAKQDAWQAKKNSVLQDRAKEAKYRKLAGLDIAEQDTFWGLFKELGLRLFSRSHKQSPHSDDPYKKDSTRNLLKRLGKAFLYYIPIANGLLSPIEPAIVQENFLRTNTLRLIIGRLNRVLRELEEPRGFLPLFFSWFGVIYALRLVIDVLDITDKAFLQPRSENHKDVKKWPVWKLWSYRFIKAFLEGNRPLRMLNDVAWVGINVASIILTSGMSVVIINVAGFSMDTLIDIYRGARDLFKDFLLYRKLNKRFKHLDKKLKKARGLNNLVEVKKYEQDIAGIKHFQHELKFKMLSEGLNNLRQIAMTGLILAGMVMLYFPPTSLAGMGTIIAASLVFGAGTVNSIRTLWEFGKSCVNGSKFLFSKIRNAGKLALGKIRGYSQLPSPVRDETRVIVEEAPSTSSHEGSEVSPSLMPLPKTEVLPNSIASINDITASQKMTSDDHIISTAGNSQPVEAPQEELNKSTSSSLSLRLGGLTELAGKPNESTSSSASTIKRLRSTSLKSAKEILPSDEILSSLAVKDSGKTEQHKPTTSPQITPPLQNKPHLWRRSSIGSPCLSRFPDSDFATNNRRFVKNPA